MEAADRKTDRTKRGARPALLGLALLLSAPALAEDAAPAPPASPAPVEGAPSPEASAESVLEAAFANRYDVDTIYDVELRTDAGASGVSQRRLHTVTKIVDGRSRSIGRLTEPATLRGMTVMIIETDDGARDTFVYLPALKRGRRISGAQRSDAFLGTELNFEDFERQRASDFTLERLADEEVAGETCAVIRGVPREAAAYDWVDFVVAADGAILEYRYWRKGAPAAYRVIRAPREHMVEQAGHLLPTRFAVTNLTRGVTTEAVILDMDVDADIDERLFSQRTLEQERPLPKIR